MKTIRIIVLISVLIAICSSLLFSYGVKKLSIIWAENLITQKFLTRTEGTIWKIERRYERGLRGVQLHDDWLIYLNEEQQPFRTYTYHTQALKLQLLMNEKLEQGAPVILYTDNEGVEIDFLKRGLGKAIRWFISSYDYPLVYRIDVLENPTLNQYYSYDRAVLEHLKPSFFSKLFVGVFTLLVSMLVLGFINRKNTDIIELIQNNKKEYQRNK